MNNGLIIVVTRLTEAERTMLAEKIRTVLGSNRAAMYFSDKLGPDYISSAYNLDKAIRAGVEVTAVRNDFTDFSSFVDMD